MVGDVPCEAQKLSPNTYLKNAKMSLPLIMHLLMGESGVGGGGGGFWGTIPSQISRDTPTYIL